METGWPTLSAGPDHGADRVMVLLVVHILKQLVLLLVDINLKKYQQHYKQLYVMPQELIVVLKVIY